MMIIDFAASPGKAFRNGFLKGLGAPFMLHGTFESSAAIPNVNPVLPATGSGGLASDWRRIGQDMRSAIRKYEQENPITK